MGDNFWSCPHQCDARTCPACLAKYGPIPARPDPLDAKIAELERNQCPVTCYPQTTGRCERLSERDRLQEELSLIHEEYAKSDKHVRDAHQEMAAMEQERDRLQARVEELAEERRNQARQHQEDARLWQIERDRLQARVTELETLIEHWKWQQGEAHDRGDRMCVERDEARAECERLKVEAHKVFDGMMLREPYETLRDVTLPRVTAERDEARAECARLREALEAAQPYVEHMGLACTKNMVAEALAPGETRGNNETVK